MDELGLGPLQCSMCGKDLLGTAAVVSQPAEVLEAGAEPWGDGMTVYESTKTSFLLLHPQCLHGLLDEVLRQESATVMMLNMGKIEDIREALQM